MSRQFKFAHGNSNLLTAISILLTASSILLTAISIYSRQFQFTHGNFNFTYGNFNFTYGNFNLLTAISICSRQFQFTHCTAISIFSRQRSRHFSLRSSPVNFGGRQWPPKVKTQNQKSKRKIKSRFLKSIFKVKSENQNLKVNSRTLMPVDSE